MYYFNSFIAEKFKLDVKMNILYKHDKYFCSQLG